MSDGLTANTILDWQFVSNEATDKQQIKVYKTGRKVTAKDGEGEPILDANDEEVQVDQEVLLLQRAPIWTLVRKRRFIGLTKHKPQNGEKERTFDLMTGPQTQLNFSSIGRIGDTKFYLCVGDRLTIINERLGEGLQQQTWIYIGPWETLSQDIFDTASPDPEDPSEPEPEPEGL